MRIFLCFLVGISLTIGDKLDRTYLPPPGSKLSGGSDGDLLGPLDYSRPSKDQLGSQPETEGPISNVLTQFGQRPSDQGFIAKENVGQITSGTRRPYQGTQQGVIDGSVPSSGSDQRPQTDRNEPLSRLPIPGSRTSTKYQVTSLPQRATTPKYNPTSAPSRFDTQAPFDFEPSEGFKPEDGTVYQQSNTRKNFPSINKKDFDINTPAAPVEDSQEEDQADNYEKNRNRLNQNVSKPESTGRYPQENVKDYYQGSRTTIRPSTFAPKEQSYFYKSKPTVPSRKVTESQRPAEYSEEYPEDTVSGQGNFNRQGYPTTARPSTFAPKDQTSYSKTKTVTPSRVVTVTKSDRPTQYSEDYPQENVSDENNYFRQGTSTARPSTFAPKDQTYYSKQKTVAPSRVVTEPKSELPTQYSEQYPQGNLSDENNYYRQGTSTIQPTTFAMEEEKYFAEKESTPSQRPDISRVKSGRPTFGKPTYSTSSSRPVQPESDYYDQYSTTVPETDAQDDINAFEDNSKTIKPYSSERPSIDEPKAAIKSEYTTASPYNDVTISDFEEGLIKANEKYGQNIPTDAQDIKPLKPTVPAFRNQGGLVPEFKRPERPQAEGDRNAVIINYQNEITPEGNFAYSFDTSNGIHADESGTASDGVRAQGEYSYTGDDGRFYSVFYSADENGFQPRGDHLPTPPPIPEAILRVIEQAQRDKEAGISNDGSYDENKYGYKKYNGPVVGQPKLFDKTQEAFVTDNRRPINKLSQGKYRPIMGKYDDSEDNKDYLDVEKAEDEANPEETSNKDDGNQYTSQFTRRPNNKTIKQNERPGVSQKQERVDSNAPVDRYYSSRKPTVEVSQDDEETVEDTNASDDQEVYPNVSQKETSSRPERIQSKYDSGRRGPTNVVKGQDVTFGEFVSSDDNKGERVTGIQKGIKVGPTKAPVKSNRFPEQKNRPYDDIPANDDSTQINLSNVEKEEINVTPESFINNKIRVQSTPTGSQSNQDRFVKYKPGSRIREDDFDSVRRTPAVKAQERFYDTNRDEQRYPTQKLNKTTNVKVDDFGREIQSEVSDITTLDDESNERDFDSIKPSTFESQQKIAPQNRYTQRPTGTQRSGYDYIPPRNKFIQEPNRTLNKYTTDGKKTISPSATADVSSAGEEEKIVEQPENTSEDRTYNGVVNPVTVKPKTKSPRPASTSPIDSEYEYKKQYNKLFGQEPEKLASVTSTRKPFFAPESRVTYKPIERTGSDNQVSADEEKEFIGTDFDRNDKDEEILQRPTPSDQRLPSRTYSKTSRPEFNQNLRPNGEEKESFGGDYNRTDEEVQNIPTTSFERPTSDQRPTSGTFSKISRPGSNRIRPTDYNVPSTTYRPVFSVSVTENKFEDSNYPTESSKVFDNENKRIPSNVNVKKTSKIRPVGSTTTAATDGSRFVTETKTVGEDFSGPQRPQYYDAQTGYHY